MQPTTVVRIAIVDDHPLVRDGLSSRISREHDMQVCGEAGGISDGLQIVKEQAPDAVIVDICLRDGTGFDLVKQIKALDANIRVLVVSIHDDELYAERSLEAGAAGYVNKREVTLVLMSALRQILDGGIYLNPRITGRLVNRAASGIPSDISRIAQLTNRERQVFSMLGRGQSSSSIARQLNLSANTVDSYRERIKKKLELQDGSQLIRHAVHWALESASALHFHSNTGLGVASSQSLLWP